MHLCSLGPFESILARQLVLSVQGTGPAQCARAAHCCVLLTCLPWYSNAGQELHAVVWAVPSMLPQPISISGVQSTAQQSCLQQAKAWGQWHGSVGRWYGSVVLPKTYAEGPLLQAPTWAQA